MSPKSRAKGAMPKAADTGTAAANVPQDSGDTQTKVSQAPDSSIKGSNQPGYTSHPVVVQIGGLTIKAAKGGGKGKAVKSTRPYCKQEYGHGPGQPTTRCQLRVLDGYEFCVNHVPAEARLTAEELTAIDKWVNETLTSGQRTVAFVRLIGWSKVKSILGTGTAGSADGDRVVGDLFEGLDEGEDDGTDGTDAA